jgi:hypothetical protein
MRTLWRVFVGVLPSFVLGAGVCFGQSAGFVHGEAVFDFDDPWPDAVEIDFEVGAEYSVSDWSFGALVDIEQFGLEDLAFLATGSLGALNVYSLYWLEAVFGDGPIPGVDLDADWDNAIWMDVAGVELWAFFSIRAEDWLGDHLSGTGLALGGHGSAGDVELWAEVQFNLWELLPFIYWNGFERTLDQNLACDLIDVIDPTCGLDFSFAEVYVELPFCCADPVGWIGFDCEGFYGFEVWIDDLAIGDTGLVWEWIDLWFEAEEKDLELRLGLDVGEAVCIRPYVTLLQADPATVLGLEVDALELACTVGDVTVVVSELLCTDDYYIGTDGAIHPYEWIGSGWKIPTDCVDEAYGVEEAIAIEVGRDGCCGNESFVGLYSFFDVDLDDAMFDWLGVRARAVTPISSSLSLYIEAWIWSDGIESIALGFDATWGTLKSVTSDWTCCLGST